VAQLAEQSLSSWQSGLVSAGPDSVQGVFVHQPSGFNGVQGTSMQAPAEDLSAPAR